MLFVDVLTGVSTQQPEERPSPDFAEDDGRVARDAEIVIAWRPHPRVPGSRLRVGMVVVVVVVMVIFPVLRVVAWLLGRRRRSVEGFALVVGRMRARPVFQQGLEDGKRARVRS